LWFVAGLVFNCAFVFFLFFSRQRQEMLSVSNEALEKMRTQGAFALGIDEAGRGPVLGPMVYGGYFCPVKEKELKGFGYADSKVLTDKQREKLFEKAQESGHGWRVIVLQASDLSKKMLRKNKYNLNLISHDAAAELIQYVLDAGVQLDEVFVDTVGDPNKYRTKLQEQFPGVGTIRVEKKADSLFPVVSAASICAKVTRDRVLAEWQFEERNLDASRVFGSGYPGDPKTKQWLKSHSDPVFGFPSLIRFSWKTTTTALENVGACRVYYGDEEEEDDQDRGPVFVFRQTKRARYFAEREMSASTTEF
jgi:ribonuclease H2 subunit A